MSCSRLTALGSALALTALPAAASEGGGGGSALIEPHFGTVVWTLVTFAILVFVLGKFAWKPLLGALDAREKSIESSIEQARKDREEAEAILQEQRDLLSEARRERAEALAAGQRDAEGLKAEILDAARAQREQLLKQTDAQVEAGMRQARSELREEAVDLALRAAEKLLTRNLDPATHRKLVEEYLADLERSGSSGSLPS